MSLTSWVVRSSALLILALRPAPLVIALLCDWKLTSEPAASNLDPIMARQLGQMINQSGNYHPLSAWASVISGLIDMVLELNIESDLPVDEDFNQEDITFKSNSPPKSPTFTPLTAITGWSLAMYFFACSPQRVRRTEKPDRSTRVRSLFGICRSRMTDQN